MVEPNCHQNVACMVLFILTHPSKNQCINQIFLRMNTNRSKFKVKETEGN